MLSVFRKRRSNIKVSLKTAYKYFSMKLSNEVTKVDEVSKQKFVNIFMCVNTFM